MKKLENVFEDADPEEIKQDPPRTGGGTGGPQ